MTERAEAIAVHDLYKRFGALEVLKGISLTAREGDVIAIIGGSGSGKSTFLRCINMLEVPSRGSVAIRGEEIALRSDRLGGLALSDRRQVQRLRARLGMVFQSFNLWQHMTIIQNVIEAPVHVLGVPKAEAIERGEALLRRVGLFDKRDVYPAFLSGGQQQRAAIARALAIQPHAMLFDEPTSALDPELVGEVLEVIRRLAVEEGLAMIISTHQLRFAGDVADRIVFLSGGVVVEEGPAARVLSAPQHPLTMRFLSSMTAE